MQLAAQLLHDATTRGKGRPASCRLDNRLQSLGYEGGGSRELRGRKERPALVVLRNPIHREFIVLSRVRLSRHDEVILGARVKPSPAEIARRGKVTQRVGRLRDDTARVHTEQRGREGLDDEAAVDKLNAL